LVLLFATVAADAMLQGTRPPARQAVTTLGIAELSCPEGQVCRARSTARKVVRIGTSSEQCQQALRPSTI
jgi:hypothetical protein